VERACFPATIMLTGAGEKNHPCTKRAETGYRGNGDDGGRISRWNTKSHPRSPCFALRRSSADNVLLRNPNSSVERPGFAFEASVDGTSSQHESIAGTCPVTDWSGKRRVVKFRHACDREFRDIAQKWAVASKSESLWATTYWQQVRPRCDSDSHAYRCLVNRWLAIAWKLWQTRRVYDEAYHLQQRTKHSKPRR
jgi:hypothetical protein